MTFQKIASELAKREGKKSQAKIADIRELLSQLVKWDAEFEATLPPGDMRPGPIYTLAVMSEKLEFRIRERAERAVAKAKRAAKAKVSK
jgi:hypothetical protein